MTKALVVLSGGQDSTTCLFWSILQYGLDNVSAITFDYNQRHEQEIVSALVVTNLAGITKRHELVKVGPVLTGTSPLTNKNENLEQYKDWQSLPGGLEKTFVPGRNALFMVLAANRAYCGGQEHIVMGLSQEDYGGYPDCREGFINAMTAGLNAGMEKDFEFVAPLLHMTKAESVKLALGLPGCYTALGYSHTAYDGAYPPTGKDHATLLRAKGFEEAGYPDPLIVRAYWEQKLEELPSTSNYANYDLSRENNTSPSGIRGALSALENNLASNS